MSSSIVSSCALFAFACLAGTLSAACSGASSSTPGDAGVSSAASSNSNSNDAAPSTSDGGFSLAATSATTTTNLRGFLAKDGDVFLVVDITFANASAPTPLSVNPVLFSVSTTASLVVAASPSTAMTTTPCRAEISVAAGGTTSCELAFEVSLSDSPTTIHYDDARGHRGEAALPSDANSGSTACEKVGALKNGSSSACQSCLIDNCSKQWAPTSEPPCDAARTCQSSCTTCACLEACEPTNDCRTALDDLFSCLAASCAAECE